MDTWLQCCKSVAARVVARRWFARGAKAKSSLFKFIKCIFFLKDSFCTQKILSFEWLVWYFAGGHLLRIFVLVCASFRNFWFCPFLFISSSPPLFSHLVLPPHNHVFFIFNNRCSKILYGSSWKQLRQGQYQNTDSEGDISDFMDWALQAIFDLMWIPWLLQVQWVLDMGSHVVSSCSKVSNLNLTAWNPFYALKGCWFGCDATLVKIISGGFSRCELQLLI